MNGLLRALWADDTAQDMSEYGILLAVLAVAVAAAVILLRDQIAATIAAAAAVLGGVGGP